MRCDALMSARALKMTERPELRTGRSTAMCVQCKARSPAKVAGGQRDLRSMRDARHPGTIMASEEISKGTGRVAAWRGSPLIIIALSPGKRGRAKTSRGIIARVPA